MQSVKGHPKTTLAGGGRGLRTVYKPRRQVRGVAQIFTLLNKSYLVKVSTKGEGGQKCHKFCLRGLYTAPYLVRMIL